MKILVCSSSKIKHDAVVAALRRLGLTSSFVDIRAHETPSGVPNQPLGDAQTLLGALTRAGSGVPGYYVVAIENGVGQRGDLTYVVVVAPSGHISVRSSRVVPVPPELVAAAKESGQETTCGQLEAARTPGCDPADPHVVWSGGTTNRLRLLTDAVTEALDTALSAEGGVPGAADAEGEVAP